VTNNYRDGCHPTEAGAACDARSRRALPRSKRKAPTLAT